MIRTGLVIIALAVGAAAPAWSADCQRPAKIRIPDPAKADAKDFEKTYADLNRYHKAVTDYNTCLQREAADAGAEYTGIAQDYEKAVKAYNSAVDKANKGQ